MSRFCVSYWLTVAASGVIDNIVNWAKFKQDQALKKTDGHKRSRCVFPTTSSATNADLEKPLFRAV